MTEQKGPKEQKIPAVLFEPEAYMKAMLHVLRFASNALNKDAWVEVYGWLVGKLEIGESKIVHIYDAVPIHHGKDIEVVFDAETYVRAAEFDEQLYQKAEENAQMKGYFIVGWYHSHPGLDFFLSPTDVSNHLGFQGPNPYSIAIVFDHTKIVPYKHLGFKIFRLDEATTESEYKEIDFDKSKFTKEVMDIIYQTQSIVERIQGNQLFTAEIGEVPSIFAHLMLPGATPTIEKTPPLDLDALFDKMLKSTEALIQKMLGTSIIGKLAAEMNPALEEWYSAFIPYVVSSLNKWLLTTAEKLVTTNKLTLGSIYTIAGAIEKSMKNVNEWTKAQLGDSERHLKKLVDGSSTKLATQVQEKLGAHEASIAKQLEALKEQVAKNEERSSVLASKIESLGAQLAAIHDLIGGMEARIQDKIQEQLTNINTRVDASFASLDQKLKDQVDKELSSFKTELQDIGNSFKKEMQNITSMLAHEKQELDELVASKSIKKMQEDLHKISVK